MSDQAIILELARPRQQPVANTNKDQYTVSVIAEGDPVLFRVRAKPWTVADDAELWQLAGVRRTA
jgi:uncharacterized Fe-S cluster protein YjdI